MSIFQHLDYRAYIRERLKALPKKGWGSVAKLADHLSVHSVQISQVMSGKKDFTPEQAIKLSAYFSLTELEKDFLLWLILRARAGSQELVKECDRHLDELRRRAEKVTERISADQSLNEKQMATFYSSPLYSAVRLYTSLDVGKTLDDVITEFKIERPRAVGILDFLVQAGLCSKEDETYKMRMKRTTVGRDSPYLKLHHINWRMLGLQNFDALEANETMISSAASVSRQDFRVIQEKTLDFVKEISEIIRNSPAEVLVSWNLDWFKLKF